MGLLDKITTLFKGKTLAPKAEYNRYQNMRLIEGGWWAERPYWPTHNRSLDKEVTLSEYRVLVSASNRLYYNYGAITNCVNAFAQYVVGSSFSPVFQGDDKEWGALAEKWLHDALEVAYTDGTPWALGLVREIIMLTRDGDCGTIFTESKGGFPQLQQVAWHQIASREGTEIVKEGKYRGLPQWNGVIKNKEGRPVAYRLIGALEENDRDISAQNMQLTMESIAPDQSRGFPAFTAAIRDLRTTLSIGNNIRQAAELASTLGLIVHNEMGMADPLDPAYALQDVPPIGQSGLRVEERMGGSIQYFRAGAGEKLEQLKNEIPTEATDRLLERLLRNAMLAGGFPPEFFWKPAEASGANSRMVVEQVNRKIARTQHILKAACKRRIGYFVSKAIKLGQLPPYKGKDKGGFLKWTFTRPPILTLDQGYANSAALDAYRAGLRTMTEIVGEGGHTLEQHLDLREKEGIAIRERMERSDLPLECFVTFTPNGNIGQQQTISNETSKSLSKD
jgi:hypothetical protein